jgi:hypothetical protein
MNTLTRDDEPRPAGDAKGNEGNQVRVAGPGDVRILQKGAADALNTPAPRPAGDRAGNLAATQASAAKPPPQRRPAPGGQQQQQQGEEEMKLTYVSFLQRMDGNSLTNVANFWGGVQVLNFPSENPNEEIDLDAILARPLPQGWMYLRCDRLRVFDRPENGHSNQQMQAYGRVRVLAREFTAEADVVTYEEKKDLVVFIGDRNNPAILTKQPFVGGPRQTLSGEKIYYIRSTGAAQVEGADRINR